MLLFIMDNVNKVESTEIFNQNYKLLKKEASILGYSTYLMPNRYSSCCAHLSQVIHISAQSGEVNAIFEFAHELGHCLQFKKIWIEMDQNKELVKDYYRRKDKSKLSFIWIEIDAWIKGYSILKENEIVTKGYIIHAFYCVKSHLKTKPNRVR